MGRELFGIDIADIVAEHIGPGVHDVLISREQRAARAPGDLTGGLVKGVPLTFPCKGFWEDFSGLPPPGIEILLNDRRLVLIGDTIPEGGIPERNDAVTCDGQTLYVVQLLSRDPAHAVYKYLCRDRRGPDGE